MCGIAGFLQKSNGRFNGSGNVPAVGATLLKKLTGLECRGPDLAGVAIWGARDDRGNWAARVKLGDNVNDVEAARRAEQVLGAVEQMAPMRDIERAGGYVRLALEGEVDPLNFERAVQS